MTLQSLQKELVGLRQNPVDRCSVNPLNNNMFHWEATIQGPQNTPYEGGRFKLHIELTQDYPFKAPKVTFKTQIYHPNVVPASGRLCLDWDKTITPGTANYTVRNTMIATLATMNVPNPDSAWNEEAAEDYKYNRAAFTVKAVKWTEQYAK